MGSGRAWLTPAPEMAKFNASSRGLGFGSVPLDQDVEISWLVLHERGAGKGDQNPGAIEQTSLVVRWQECCRLVADRPGSGAGLKQRWRRRSTLD